jgi:chemotaxis protein CheY-P-specific phosphatase CheC
VPHPHRPTPLTDLQLRQLTPALHRGAIGASSALARWLATPTTMAINTVDQCPLARAMQVLGEGDQAICMCLMQMQQSLTGHMLLAFDDASGLAVADLLLSRPAGTATSWGDVERSCILETMNIAGSAYLNGIAEHLSDNTPQFVELIPTPPTFIRDFAESLLETAFLEQATAGNDVVFTLAEFNLAGRPLHWTFLLIPDPPSLQKLADLLTPHD